MKRKLFARLDLKLVFSSRITSHYLFVVKSMHNNFPSSVVREQGKVSIIFYREMRLTKSWEQSMKRKKSFFLWIISYFETFPWLVVQTSCFSATNTVCYSSLWMPFWHYLSSLDADWNDGCFAASFPFHLLFFKIPSNPFFLLVLPLLSASASSSLLFFHQSLKHILFRFPSLFSRLLVSPFLFTVIPWDF